MSTNLNNDIMESPSLVSIDIRPKPTEVVFAYIEKEFLNDGSKSGCRLPTTRALAKHLGVSISTTQKVLKTLQNDGHLHATPGRGTFVAKQKKSAAPIVITMGGLHDTTTNLWETKIGGFVIQAAASMKNPVSILPLTPAASHDLHAETDWKNKTATAAGIIILPHPSRLEIVRDALRRELPYIALHPTGMDNTADFVSPDYAEICRLMALAAIKAGRRRIALIQAKPSGLSLSGFLRSAGLLDAIGDQLGRQVHFQIVNAPFASASAGREAASALFKKGGFRPDFVFCMGDLLAHGFLNQLSDDNISCPDEVSVVAGTGLSHSPDPWPNMTTVEQPLRLLGQTLLQTLIRRIELGFPLPGIYLPCSFRGGATTLPAENELLFAPASLSPESNIKMPELHL